MSGGERPPRRGANDARAKEPTPVGPVDPEALLVALVLAPATYSRNRFFSLYADAAARRARRRASLVRSLVRHLGAPGPEIVGLDVRPHPSGHGFEATYEVPSLGLRRRASLDALELALVRYVTAHRRGVPTEVADRHRIETALKRLPEGRAHALGGVGADDDAEAMQQASGTDGGDDVHLL